MSLKKQAARGGIWISVTRTGTNIIDFAVFAYLARILTLEEFGLVGFCLLFIEFANIAVNSGVNQNIIQRKKWDVDYASSTMIYVFGLAVCAALFMILLVAPVLYYTYSDIAAYVVMSMAPIVLIMSLQTVLNGKLAREFKNKQMGMAKFLASILSGALIIALAEQGYGLWSLVIGRIINAAIELCFLSYVANFKPKLKFNKADNKELIDFCFPLLGSAMLSMAHQRATSLFTGLVLGPASFALLNAAKKGEQMISQVTLSSINSMVVPSFARAKEGANLGDLYIKLVAITATLVLPIFMGIGAIADPFVTIAFGEKFSDSALFMTISAFAMIPGLLGWFLPSLLISQAKTADALKLNIISVISSVGVAGLTIWFGISVMLISIVITNILILPIRFKITKKHIPIDVKKLLLGVLPQNISSLFMYTCIMLFKDLFKVYISSDILLLITLILFGISAYLIFSFTIFYQSTVLQIQYLKDIFLSNKKLNLFSEKNVKG